MDKLLRLEDVARLLSADLTVVERLIQSGHLAALELAPGETRVAARDYRRFVNIRRRDFSETTASVLAVNL